MITLHEDKALKIFYDPGEGNTTLVSFSGIDFDTFGFGDYNPDAIDRPEFVKITAGLVGDRFWIIDKLRSWGSLMDWDWIHNFISPYLHEKRVIALGNCMGGTNAIKFAYHTDVDRVIAFTPHWSIHPDIITQEIFDKRTIALRARVVASGWKSLEGMFRPMTTYIHFWTPDAIDVPHMIAYPTIPNIEKIFFPTSEHSIARLLKSKGVLYDILDQCIVAEDPPKEISILCDKAGILHELS
jgi:hypothetical protein